MTSAHPPVYVEELSIRTTPERLWQAISDPALTRRYFYGTAVDSSFVPGDPIVYHEADGSRMLEGEVLARDPVRRLIVTFGMDYSAETRLDRRSRVSREIEPGGDACKLTLTHDDFDGVNAASTLR